MKKLCIDYRMENETGIAESCIILPMVEDIADEVLTKGEESEYLKPTIYGYLHRLLQNLAEIQGYELTGFCSAKLVEE